MKTYEKWQCVIIQNKENAQKEMQMPFTILFSLLFYALTSLSRRAAHIHACTVYDFCKREKKRISSGKRSMKRCKAL